MLTFCWGLLHLCFSGMSLLFYVQLFWGPMDCSPPASSVHGISQEKYWSGLPFPSPWDLPNPGIWTCVSCIADRFFTTEPLRKPFYKEYWPLIFFVCVCVCVCVCVISLSGFGIRAMMAFKMCLVVFPSFYIFRDFENDSIKSYLNV